LDAFCVQDGDPVVPYDLVLDVTPSSDLTLMVDAIPAAPDNDDSGNSVLYPEPMTIETQDDGIIRRLRTDLVGQWVLVGTEIGMMDDGDAIDGDWTWQAYKKG
jgi:hypothetical protein